MREIWPIEVILHIEHVVMGLHMSPIAFGCLCSFFGPILRLFIYLFIYLFLLWQLDLLGFFNFTNPNLWLQDYFGNLDLIHF